MDLKEAIENTKNRIKSWENIAEIGKHALSKEEYENSQNICDEQKILIEELEHLQKENEELRKQNKILECCRYASANWLDIEKIKTEECKRWKDKIREEIEELEKLISEALLECGSASKEFTIYVHQQRILQDLLKEE